MLRCLSKNNRTWQCLTLQPAVRVINLTVTLSLRLSRWSEQWEAVCRCSCLPLNRESEQGSGVITQQTLSLHTATVLYTQHTDTRQYVQDSCQYKYSIHIFILSINQIELFFWTYFNLSCHLIGHAKQNPQTCFPLITRALMLDSCRLSLIGWCRQ